MCRDLQHTCSGGCQLEGPSQRVFFPDPCGGVTAQTIVLFFLRLFPPMAASILQARRLTGWPLNDRGRAIAGRYCLSPAILGPAPAMHQLSIHRTAYARSNALTLPTCAPAIGVKESSPAGRQRGYAQLGYRPALWSDCPPALGDTITNVGVLGPAANPCGRRTVQDLEDLRETKVKPVVCQDAIMCLIVG